MRVLRGRADDPAADAAATGAMVERTAADGDPALRVWRPHRQVAFGRRDTRAEGYRRAREAAIERGFPPTERRVGGRAAAYTGTTVAFALARPVDDVRSGIDERYETVTAAVQRALWRLDVPAQRGEPANSFCPGNHSLQWKGKIAGFAQRVRQGAALVGGIVIVDGHEEVAEVLAPVYAALEVPFDPGRVGSVDLAGGRADADEVAGTVEEFLVGDAPVEVEQV